MSKDELRIPLGTQRATATPQERRKCNDCGNTYTGPADAAAPCPECHSQNTELAR